MRLDKFAMRLHRRLSPLARNGRKSISERLLWRLLAPLYKVILNWRFSGDVPLAAQIGEGLKTPHGFNGVFISPDAIIGDDVRLYQNVTIGTNRGRPGKPVSSPVIGNRVLISANATIIGKCRIGDDATIGAGVTLVDAEVRPGEVIIDVSAYSLTRKAFIYAEKAEKTVR